jgi:urease accessory protein
MPMDINAPALLLLLNWMSPTFPTGSFAYSHGMEQAIADGDLATPQEVEAWIAALLQQGSLWCDAVLFSLCWREGATTLDAHALALAGSASRFLETTALGKAFSAASNVWADDEGANAGLTAYPVVAGAACARHGIDAEAALAAYLQGSCAVLVSVAVRLVPLGQTAGLTVLRNLAPVLAETARRARDATMDDIANVCVLAEIASMRHETLEPRIFRT